ncbi:molybdenum cofactor carrier protein [Sulfuriroseicoccus oceanibius]|uniref:Uncharacterized protein n=1 Tax=Sulfuriroseicoccus oceanibius TaxID=2707525 RepID=A0A6B3LEZ2_9BACT|nr:molybdenum cofactor carrier protein [Sulfuriroseicoccus oceanibius]QQL44972.1 hypothetical protein G3M56_014065 [Sulfuriroseicoccus oceanibius]
MPPHPAVNRLPIIGVMGSGSFSYDHLAHDVGTVLAGEGVHLLTGGGEGIMEAVSRSFVKARFQGQGRVLGVIPGNSNGTLHPSHENYPNPWVEIPIYTHLPLTGITGTSTMSRNHINILTSQVLIFLPGSAGTASEHTLAQQYNKPMIGYFPEGLVPPFWNDDYPTASSPEQLTVWLRKTLQSLWKL